LELAPERYDPRRESLNGARDAVLLGEIATVDRRTVSPSKNGGSRCLVLDTSDVREGLVVGQKGLVDGSEIGSAKKVAEPGEVIVSRLRPYLRQVGFVDAGILNYGAGVQLAFSTEFYVLRSMSGASIAFLVPLLLSEPVQQVLAASQEGGHHPRFNESVLLDLPVPRRLLEQRAEVSRQVERAVEEYRRSEEGIGKAIKTANECFSKKRGCRSVE
jgi:hypothetical protein